MIAPVELRIFAEAVVPLCPLCFAQMVADISRFVEDFWVFAKEKIANGLKNSHALDLARESVFIGYAGEMRRDQGWHQV